MQQRQIDPHQRPHGPTDLRRLRPPRHDHRPRVESHRAAGTRRLRADRHSGLRRRTGGAGRTPHRDRAPHARPHRRLEPPRDVRPRRRIARRLGHPRREHPPDHRRRRHPLGRVGRRTRRGRPHRLVYHGIRPRLHRRRDRLHARRRTSAPAAQVCLRLLVEPLLAILRRRAGAAGRADTEPLHTDRRSDSRHGVARHVGSVEHRHQARRVRPAHRLGATRGSASCSPRPRTSSAGRTVAT